MKGGKIFSWSTYWTIPGEGVHFFLMMKKDFGRGCQILLVVYQMIYPRGGGHFFLVVKFGEEKFGGGLKILLMVMICPRGGVLFFLAVTLGTLFFL